jgi:HEPN domain-containing protein
MVDTKRYLDWFSKADQDLKSAKILFEHEGDLWVVVFHCQQAAEKYLKGYILVNTGMIVEGHNLYRLCKKAVESDKRFEYLLKDSGYLSNYYIETRYPAEDPLSVTIKEAEECFHITESIRELVYEVLGLEES